MFPVNVAAEELKSFFWAMTKMVPTSVITRPIHATFESRSLVVNTARPAVHIGQDDIIKAVFPAVVRKMPVKNVIW